MEVMNGFICRFAKTLYISVCLLWAVACVQPGSRNQTIADQSLQGTQAIDHARIEAGEVCVINTNEREVEKLDRFANSKGYVKKKRRVLEGLGFIMTILEGPKGQNIDYSILELRHYFPSQIIDLNHLYDLQGLVNEVDPHRYGYQLVGWTEKTAGCGSEALRIGIVDTFVDTSQPFLKNQSIQKQSFLSKGETQTSGRHGTAVSTLLIGSALSRKSGLLPNATLLVAETFRQLDSNQVEATTWSIVRALDWLVKENVLVINLSLGGPQNALLNFAIEKTLNLNIPIVAAAGNTGPHGPYVYPAAIEGVIAVTALDAKLNPYHYATKGPYIDFSAPGVDIWIPSGNGTGIFKSGTSFAVPFATAAIAVLKRSHPDWNLSQLASQLVNDSLDLGKKGKDNVFGWGLVKFPRYCQN